LQSLPKCYASDWLYNQALFYSTFKRFFSMRRPKSFNEKLQVLKLRQRSDPTLSVLVDKVGVRQFVADRIGREYLIPVIGIWNCPEDMDWDALPNAFVLKLAHGSGYNLIIENHHKLDREKAFKQIRVWQATNHYHIFREYPYNAVRPRIICERLLAGEDGGQLKDYKFYCFYGKPAFIEVDVDRFGDHRMNFYDMEWALQPFRKEYPMIQEEIPRPIRLSEMRQIAETLSAGLPFARVDLYESAGRVYFGEITLYPAGGWGKFDPPEYDYILGDMLKIARK
jgi:hypothetical protein